MKTQEKSSTWMGIGRHGFQCQFDLLSTHIQPYKRALMPIKIFVQCSELWISKHFPSVQTFPQFSVTSTAHIQLQCHSHNLEGNRKHSRQQTHSKKESEAKLHILTELKTYTPVGSISHSCLWVPNAMTNTTWSEAGLCLVSHPIRQCGVPYAVSLLSVKYSISIIITAEDFLKGRFLVSSF